MTGRLRKSVTIGACLVFIVMSRRADFYSTVQSVTCFLDLCVEGGLKESHAHVPIVRFGSTPFHLVSWNRRA